MTPIIHDLKKLQNFSLAKKGSRNQLSDSV